MILEKIQDGQIVRRMPLEEYVGGARTCVEGVKRAFEWKQNNGFVPFLATCMKDIKDSQLCPASAPETLTLA